jgi:hypothetical protein
LKFAPIVRGENHYETSCSFHQEDNKYPLNELCLGIHGTIQHFLKNCPLKVEQPLMIEEKNYTKTWRVFRATNNK